MDKVYAKPLKRPMMRLSLSLSVLCGFLAIAITCVYTCVNYLFSEVGTDSVRSSPLWPIMIDGPLK